MSGPRPVASSSSASYNDSERAMEDELLQELKALPTRGPEPSLRREVRVAALERLEMQRPQSRWLVLWRQLAVPLALSAFSVLYLLRAAADTPLLR